jgi:hypothetical protein
MRKIVDHGFYLHMRAVRSDDKRHIVTVKLIEVVKPAQTRPACRQKPLQYDVIAHA